MIYYDMDSVISILIPVLKKNSEYIRNLIAYIQILLDFQFEMMYKCIAFVGTKVKG